MRVRKSEGVFVFMTGSMKSPAMPVSSTVWGPLPFLLIKSYIGGVLWGRGRESQGGLVFMAGSMKSPAMPVLITVWGPFPFTLIKSYVDGVL